MGKFEQRWLYSFLNASRANKERHGNWGNPRDKTAKQLKLFLGYNATPLKI